MIAIGADVHKGRCVFAMMTEEGKLKMLEPAIRPLAKA